MSRSPRKHPTTASSSRYSRRRFVASAAALPAAAAFRLPEFTTLVDPVPMGTSQAPPYVVVLGTAQDAGVPQVNCFTDNCNAARSGGIARPRVSSIGVVDPATRQRFLFDATPDFVDEVGDLVAESAAPGALDGSIALQEHLHGIFLTHAHMGHYTGLIHTGREGSSTRELPLYVSRRMADYLGANQPWKFLIDNGHLSPVILEPGATLELTDNLSVTPFEVVHRQEFADTLGFLIHGPDRTAMFVPDADRWEGWTPTFEHWLDRTDIALIDGSFYSLDELPNLSNRARSEVPHPPVSVSMDLLESRLDDLEVWFIHLNNSNPLWNPDSEENRIVRERGFGVATQGQKIAL